MRTAARIATCFGLAAAMVWAAAAMPSDQTPSQTASTEGRKPSVREAGPVHDAGLVEANQIDLGKIAPEKAVLRLTFRWRNQTGRTQQIDGIVLGCKCTSVTPSRETVPDRATVDFSSTVDLLGVYGKAGTNFMVKFKDKETEPLLFTFEFHRPQLAHAVPPSVDFGLIPARSGAARRFTVQAGAGEEEEGLKILDGITSTDDRVSCRLVEERRKKFRAPNTMQLSMQYTAVFEAKVAGARNAGVVSGELTIPVAFAGSKQTLRVPFRGRYADDVTPRPSRIVVIAAQSAKRKQAKIRLYRRADVSVSPGLTCRCEDRRVAIKLLDPKSHGRADLVGEISVEIDLSPGESFDTEITVEGEADGSPFDLTIPVKVRVVPG